MGQIAPTMTTMTTMMTMMMTNPMIHRGTGTARMTRVIAVSRLIGMQMMMTSVRTIFRKTLMSMIF